MSSVAATSGVRGWSKVQGARSSEDLMAITAEVAILINNFNGDTLVTFIAVLIISIYTSSLCLINNSEPHINM